RRHDLPLALAAEEQERVELRVGEGVESLVRGDRDRIPHPSSSRRFSSSTYASGSLSSDATSYRRQNARASALGIFCTAHERYATGRSPQMRLRISRRFQSAIS